MENSRFRELPLYQPKLTPPDESETPFQQDLQQPMSPLDYQKQFSGPPFGCEQPAYRFPDAAKGKPRTRVHPYPIRYCWS